MGSYWGRASAWAAGLLAISHGIVLAQPAPRHDHVALYDPAGDRMVVSEGAGAGLLRDTWTLALDGGMWVFRDSLPYVGPLGQAAVLDPVRRRVVAWGGSDGFYDSGTPWELSLTDRGPWRYLIVPGESPPSRHGHTAIYDPVRDRVVFFGGASASGLLNDVWVLSLGDTLRWSRLAPAGNPPSARSEHSAVYDAAHDRMLVFGGQDAVRPQNDVWALSLGDTCSWTQIVPAGTPPARRAGQSATLDPIGGRLLVFGGFDGTRHLNDVWALSLDAIPTWTPLRPSALPPRRENHAAIYDAARDRLVIYGGVGAGGFAFGDVWTLPLRGTLTWSEMPTAPIRRTPEIAIYDSIGDAVLLTGVDHLSSLWSLPLAGTGWSPIPSEPRPKSRANASAVFDPIRDRLVMFGGEEGVFLNDVWAFARDSGSWTRMEPAGTPPSARAGHTSIYDPRRDRMVVFGGPGRNDVWSLVLGDAPAWTRLVPTGSAPTPRWDHTAVYDPVRDRMIVFGGWDGARQNDVWSLSLDGPPTWTQLLTTGTPPAGRAGHAAIYDQARDRMLVFGGDDGAPSDQVWALSLTEPPTWSQVLPSGDPPDPALGYNAVHDTRRDRLLLIDDTTLRQDVVLGLESETWTPLRPILSLDTPIVTAPVVTIGDSVPVPIVLSNAGEIPLTVSFTHWEVVARTALPWVIPPHASLPETLILVGNYPHAGQDYLELTSNDPVAPLAVIRMDVTVLDLEFTTSVLAANGVVPVGDPLVVGVSPATGVHIEGGTLFHRPEGSGAPFDSIPFDVTGNDVFVVVPGALVTERGLEFYVVMRNSEYIATRPLFAPDSVFHQAVAPPATMTALAQPNARQGYLARREIVVEARLPVGAELLGGLLHYRRGGEALYQRAALVIDPRTSVPSATIPDSVVGERGVEFWVEVDTRTAHLTYPAIDPALHPELLRVTVPGLAENAVHPGLRYRLLSTPLVLAGDASRTLADMLDDDPAFGPYDPVRWRAFRYLPGAGTSVELSRDADAFRLAPGRAFWLVSRTDHRIDTAPLDGLSTPTDRSFPIRLEPGWNAIGNPFAFPVAWSAVPFPPGIAAPVTFDSRLGAAGDWSDDPPALFEPFEGCFVENTNATAETLWVPARAADSVAVTARKVSALANRQGWSVRLSARTAAALDGANRCGVASGAADGRDDFDRDELPAPPGPWVRLGLVDPNGDGLRSRDVRSADVPGHAWDLEVRSAVAGEAIDVDAALEGAAQAPASSPPSGGPVFCLVDRENGVALEPADRTQTVRLMSFGPARPYRLTLIAGTRDYVANAIGGWSTIPRRLVFDPITPNPTSTLARIRFGLPSAASVDLALFDLAGRRVATLLERAALAPGFRTLAWDVRSVPGGQLDSGIYFLRLTVGASTVTRRLAFIR